MCSYFCYLCSCSLTRYITWPGQAVGYKIGQLKILGLRKKAEQELGEKYDTLPLLFSFPCSRFNIKDFHETVLMAAGPLDLLEKKVEEYIGMAKAS